MLKKSTLFIVFLFIAQISFGQNVFKKGTNAFTIGGGYMIIGHADKTISKKTPTANASYERSVKTIRDIGHFAVGVYADVLFKEEEISPVFTAKTAFHLGFFRTKIMDAYFGLGAAFAPLEDSYFHPDIFVGSRFKFNKQKNLGAFTEVGYYGANIRIGLCWIW